MLCINIGYNICNVLIWEILKIKFYDLCNGKKVGISMVFVWKLRVLGKILGALSNW